MGRCKPLGSLNLYSSQLSGVNRVSLFTLLLAFLQLLSNHCDGVAASAGLQSGEPSFSRGSSRPREEELGCVLWIQGKGEEVMKHKPLRVWCFSWPSSVQCISVAQSCPTLCDPVDCSTQGLPVHHQLPELSRNSCPSSR